jgi:hypothetical protein
MVYIIPPLIVIKKVKLIPTFKVLVEILEEKFIILWAVIKTGKCKWQKKK